MKLNTMRRKRIEIFIDILEALSFNGDLRICAIMHKANIPHVDLVKRYLPFCIEEGLIAKEDWVYRITQVGRTVLRVLRKFWMSRPHKTSWILERMSRPGRC